jgi:hypothetical protein
MKLEAEYEAGVSLKLNMRRRRCELKAEYEASASLEVG